MSISLSCTPSRTSGTGPLFVQFDATASTSTATTMPFREILYVWNYGDGTAGTWSTGPQSGQSKNVGYGPIGAHCYETPGTYSPTLFGFDGTSWNTISAGTITVSDPDVTFSGTNTICFENVFTGTGGPTGCTYVTTSNFSTAISGNIGTGKRLLFKRGDTYTSGTAGTITVTGPIYIGAWSTGAKPQINRTGDSQVFACGGQNFPNSTSNLKDIRFVDLSINGGGAAECFGPQGGYNQMTFLRCDGTNGGDGIWMFNGDLLQFYNANGHGTHTVWTEIGIIDCTATLPDTWSLYLYCNKFGVMGCTIDNQLAGSHTFRMPYNANGVIQHNDIKRNGPGTAGTHVLKLHAPPFAGDNLFPASTYSENMVISDNKFTPGNASTNNWTVALDPQDNTENERLRNYIVERNWNISGTNSQLGYSIQAVSITLRNNLHDGTGAQVGTMVLMDRRSSAAAAPTDVFIENNTLFTSSNNLNNTDEPFIDIDASCVSGGTTISNNLGYSPNVSGTPSMIRDAASSHLNTNSSNAQTKTTPNFASGSPSNPSDFYITTSSYAKGAGTTIDNFNDWLIRSRVGVANDMGFYQFVQGTNPWESGGFSLGWLKF